MNKNLANFSLPYKIKIDAKSFKIEPWLSLTQDRFLEF
jgi:hypothetical protein